MTGEQRKSAVKCSKIERSFLRAIGILWVIGGIYGIIGAVRVPSQPIAISFLAIPSIGVGLWLIRARDPFRYLRKIFSSRRTS